MAFHPRILGLIYASAFLRSLPPRFDRVLLQRLERGFATHPNRTNPYAWRLLAGSDPPEAPLYGAPAPRRGIKPRPTARRADLAVRAAEGVTVLIADAAAFLERSAPASFDAFTLSNILDGASAGYRRRLLAAVERAASPGATAIVRSFGEPETEEARHLAARDRALLWGSIEVRRY